MIPLRYIHDPNFTCIVFRRTSVQCRGLGGTFDTLKDIYMKLPVEYRPQIKEGRMMFVFPSGAKVICSHLEYEKNKYDHQGLTGSPFIQ